LINFLYNLIPIAAVAPMLIFVGLIITAQAFNSNEKKYSVAVAISLIPHISNLLTTKLHSGFTALNQKITPELISAMKNQGIHWLGQTALSQGAIITGLFWGAIVSFIIDLKYIKAASFSIVAALLTLFGIIHSSNLGINFTQIFFGYLIMTILLLLAHKLKLERDSDISEF
jgi:AGZA family xanthine/uracil permease-like MFS transporter